jgi:hypothetical protein
VTPASARNGSLPVADVRFVGAWDALNPFRRSALFARVGWCVRQAAAASPCNLTATLRVNGVQWAHAGWFDDAAYVRARDAGAGNATRAGWQGPVIIDAACAA